MRAAVFVTGGKLLVESAPGVVAELTRIALITSSKTDRSPGVASVDHLTAEAGRAVLAENYAAYVAEYGEGREHRAAEGRRFPGHQPGPRP